MSVSLSSVYEQTESLRQIQQKFQQAIQNQGIFQSLVQGIITQSSNLTMSESYRLVVLLSKYLNNNSSIDKKYAALFVIKKLILTGYHHFYIFASVRVLNWVLSLTKFQPRKNQNQRVKLYVKQLSLKGNGDQVYQQRKCYKLLRLVDQFLAWFSENIPIHINAQFQFRSTFVRAYQQVQPKRSIKKYQHFYDNQFKSFQQNFNTHRYQNKQIIKQVGQFIMLEVRALIYQEKYKSQLLRECVHTSDSYCIRAIISELYMLFQDNKKIFYCLKLTQSLMNVGQIQFIELTKLYVVPVLLQYLLPYSFIQGKKLTEPMLTCTSAEQKNIIDMLCIWSKITQNVKLSNNFYTEALKAIQLQKKTKLLKIEQKHLSQFLMSIIDMQAVNNDKRSFIKNSNTEEQLIKILNLKSLKQSQPLRQTARWQAQGSAINQLNQFNQSKVSRTSKPFNIIQSPTLPTGLLKNQFLQNNPNILKIQSKQIKIPLQLSKNSEQLVTFKDLEKYNNNKQIMVAHSPKESIKLSKAVIEDRNIEESSFVAFSSSKMSKFSSFSIQNQNKQNGGGLLKNQLGSFNNAINSPKQNIKSQSQSVVYFDRSDDFHSENSKPAFQNKLKQSQQKSAYFSFSNAKSIKNLQDNQQSISTYKFDSSNISSSSIKSSMIQHFGKDNQEFPLSIPKPTFGFKKKQQQIIDNHEVNEYLGQKVLKNLDISLKADENSLSKVIANDKQRKFNLSNSSSSIKDLSGGNHQLNQSIKFSQGSEVDYVTPLRQQKNKQGLMSSKNLKISPIAQYYFNGQTKNRQKNIMQQRKYKKQKLTNQQSSNKTPKKLTLTLSQKNIKSSQVIKYEKQQKNDRNGDIQNQIRYQNINNRESQKSTKKKHIIVDQFANDRLLNLQKQLGRAMQQKKNKQQQLRRKQEQYKLLKSKSVPYMGRKMQVLKKQDQIIQILMGNKAKQEYNLKAGEYVKPVRNNNKITDYFLQNQIKSYFTPISQPYDRIFIKQLLGSRCLLLNNQQLQIGYNYSQIQNQVSFYLTFFKVFDAINVQVVQNSLVLQKQVKLFMQNQPARYQLKIKRKVKGIIITNKQPTFTQAINHNFINGYRFPEIQIKVTNQTGQQLTYQTRIPCSIFNLAKPVQLNKQTIQSLRGKKVIRSQPMPLGQQFIKNYRQKIEKYFMNNMGLVDGWTLIGYSFPKQIFGNKENQYFKFKILNGKQINIQFFNDPKSILAETIISFLTGKRK